MNKNYRTIIEINKFKCYKVLKLKSIIDEANIIRKSVSILQVVYMHVVDNCGKLKLKSLFRLLLRSKYIIMNNTILYQISLNYYDLD